MGKSDKEPAFPQHRLQPGGGRGDRQTAVDGDRGAGDEGCGVGGEERHDRSHLLRAPDAPERVALALSGVDGRDAARLHGVDADATGSVVEGELADEAVHTGLRGRIGREGRSREGRVDRGHRDDRRPRCEAGESGSCHEERRVERGAERAAPVLVARRLRAGDRHAAGREHDDVESAERLLRIRDGAVGGLRSAAVRDEVPIEDGIVGVFEPHPDDGVSTVDEGAGDRETDVGTAADQQHAAAGHTRTVVGMGGRASSSMTSLTDARLPASRREAG